ncbi:pyrroline-5-carboxylate reductase [Robertkochia marina]|uniref:Pyrroline-5-carboxylate reductase n=1 Tax=Robertkochia marina TaxID=1227945 RepID=A0A4S3M0F9_9FLAO|nr:pyrroline-5-carboxylate reductase [Robertkochia marina]THD67658.1 pyrroline-5-carboxylate reductase [Robertkochia marina]TRZ43390.1 pyrroline-5-carboxylate reductase [Robertkochia marina]
MKVTVIGSGNLGKSIISGLASSELFDPKNIMVADASPENLEIIKEQAGVSVTSNNVEAIKDSKWIILCIQPRILEIVLDEIKEHLRDDQILISTVTGVTTDEINEFVPNNKVIRAMPNTAAIQQQSMSFICANNNDDEDVEFVRKMFGTIGKAIIIEQRLMKPATVLGASGTAFFLRFLRALTQGGVQMGFHPHEAQEIVAQVAIGAASLIEDGTQAEVEVDNVTTPQGCTIEGLNAMEHNGMSSSVIKGVMAAYDKISNINGQ